jgi:hypothetical protein
MTQEKPSTKQAIRMARPATLPRAARPPIQLNFFSFGGSSSVFHLQLAA